MNNEIDYDEIFQDVTKRYPKILERLAEDYVWEIGVSSITSSAVHWTGEFIRAPDEENATLMATESGYYRNLRLRKIERYT